MVATLASTFPPRAARSPRSTVVAFAVPTWFGEQVGREREPERSWTFVTNHTRVLACIAAEPAIRLRDIAARIGITERAAQRIVGDLVDAGYLERERIGRRNVYRAHLTRTLRHPLESTYTVGALLAALSDERPLRAAQ